jgi:hypothetical protein
MLVDILPAARLYPLQLSGGEEQEVLNPLLDQAGNPNMLGLMQGVAEKRDDDLFADVVKLLHKAARPSSAGAAGHRDYGYALMAERRARKIRAADAENATRPAAKRMRGKARQDFMAEREADWAARKQAMLEAARKNYPGGKIPRPEWEEKLALFWEMIDREIDEKWEEAPFREREIAEAKKRAKKSPGRKPG